MAPWRYANIQLLFFSKLEKGIFFKGGEISLCCIDFVPTAVKQVHDHMLPTLIKAESDYVVAKRNKHCICVYVCLYQGGSSAQTTILNSHIYICM